MDLHSNPLHKTTRYLRSALSVALGAGAVLGAGYLVSRIKEKQSDEGVLSRLEQILEETAAAETAPTEKPAARSKAPKA
jgi:hypothetical protein